MATYPSSTAYPGAGVYPDGATPVRVALSDTATATDTGAMHDAANGVALYPSPTGLPGPTVFPDSGGVPNPHLPDTATADDALTVAATVPLTDTAAGTDALTVTITATIPLSDTGTGTDAITTAVTAPVTLSDTATADDAITALDVSFTPKTLTDTAAGTDAITTTATTAVTVTDTATTADDLNVTVTTVTITLTDTAAAADAVTTAGTASITLTDTGTGVDAFTHAVSSTVAKTLTDTADTDDDLGWVSTNRTDYAVRVLADHPTAYYRLNEPLGRAINDLSGNSYDGTWDGDPTPLPDGALVEADGAVQVPPGTYGTYSRAVLSLPVGDSLDAVSIEVWVRQPGLQRFLERPLFAATDSVPSDLSFYGNQFSLTCLQHVYSLRVQVAGLPQGNYNAPNPTDHYAAGGWAHVVGVYDGQQVRVWVNGQWDRNHDTGLARGRISAVPGATAELANAPNGDIAEAGMSDTLQLDEFAFYRAALSPARITVHHLAGRGELSPYRETVLVDEPLSFLSLLWNGTDDPSDPSLGHFADVSDISGNSIGGGDYQRNSTTLIPAIGGEASTVEDPTAGRLKALRHPLNGNSSYTDVGGLGVDPADADGFTIDFWLNTTQPGGTVTGDTPWFVEGWHLAPHIHNTITRAVFYLDPGGRVAFASGDSEPVALTLTTLATGTTVVNDGTWHHIGLTYRRESDTTYAIGIYVDGKPNRVATVTGDPILWHYVLEATGGEQSYNALTCLANLHGATTSIASWQSVLPATRIKAHWRAGIPGSGASADTAATADALTVTRADVLTKTLTDTAATADTFLTGEAVYLDDRATTHDAFTRDPPPPHTVPRHLVPFTAAGTGTFTAVPALDGVVLYGFTAAGVGTFTPELPPGPRSGTFTADGTGAMQAWAWATLRGGFTAAGTGTMRIAVRVGGDDLLRVGPDLSLTDPLLIGLALSGNTVLWPPEDLDDTPLAYQPEPEPAGSVGPTGPLPALDLDYDAPGYSSYDDDEDLTQYQDPAPL